MSTSMVDTISPRFRPSEQRQRTDTFFSNWLLPDGWLSPSERKRAMEIFHDRVAIPMRRAVVTKLYPDRLEFSG